MIEILTTGAPNTVQDRGRHGYLSCGISRCGAMDRRALDVGNALLGNEASAAGIEIALFPFRLRFGCDTRFALTGASGEADLDGRPLPPSWTCGAVAGQVLRLGPPRRGARTYVTVAGGVAVPPVLGSRSTDLKGGFGGHEGRGLRRGDRLALGQASGRTGAAAAAYGAAADKTAEQAEQIEVRVIRSAEYEDFDDASRQAFWTAGWQVTPEANRLGYRLAGPTLAVRRARELLSHGIVPGIVQVPASGQPIVQLADANTCGGYPKIAAVIEADLWKVGQAPVGSALRFVPTQAEEAVEALRQDAARLAELRAAATRAAGRR